MDLPSSSKNRDRKKRDRRLESFSSSGKKRDRRLEFSSCSGPDPQQKEEEEQEDKKKKTVLSRSEDDSDSSSTPDSELEAAAVVMYLSKTRDRNLESSSCSGPYPQQKEEEEQGQGDQKKNTVFSRSEDDSDSYATDSELETAAVVMDLPFLSSKKRNLESSSCSGPYPQEEKQGDKKKKTVLSRSEDDSDSYAPDSEQEDKKGKKKVLYQSEDDSDSSISDSEEEMDLKKMISQSEDDSDCSPDADSDLPEDSEREKLAKSPEDWQKEKQRESDDLQREVAEEENRQRELAEEENRQREVEHEQRRRREVEEEQRRQYLEELSQLVLSAEKAMAAVHAVPRIPDDQLVVPDSFFLYHETFFLREKDELLYRTPLKQDESDENLKKFLPCSVVKGDGSEYGIGDDCRSAEDEAFCRGFFTKALDASLDMYRKLQKENKVPYDLPFNPIDKLQAYKDEGHPYYRRQRNSCEYTSLMQFFINEFLQYSNFRRLVINRDPKSGILFQIRFRGFSHTTLWDAQVSYQFLQLFFKLYKEMEKTDTVKNLMPYFQIEATAKRLAEEEQKMGKLMRITSIHIAASARDYFSARGYDALIQRRKLYFKLKNDEISLSIGDEQLLRDFPLGCDKDFVDKARSVLKKGDTKEQFNFERLLDRDIRCSKFEKAPLALYYFEKLKVARRIGLIGGAKVKELVEVVNDGGKGTCNWRRENHHFILLPSK